MPTPNFKNRTIWTGDNLDILRGINAESVDLIYLDPPFNSNRDYAAPVGGPAAGAAFKDTWTLSDLDVAWMGLVADRHPAVYQVLETARLSHGKGMQSYLCMMAVRLLEMRRVLKATGSIYLHCDPTASHYLRLLMDAIFGPAQYRNEVIWKRTSGRSDGKRFGRVHDTLLFYTKSDIYTWNTQWLTHNKEYIKRAYRHEDGRGRWQSADLTASGPRSGESGETWKGIDPGKVGRHWNTPTQGGMSDYIIEHGIIPGWPDEYPGVQSRLDALDTAGLIVWPQDGETPRLKRYLDSTKGTAVEDIFADIARLEANSTEKVGYPTQKPLALLERIIKASSNGRAKGDHETASYPGDVVLDPFCGCATALVAAEKMGRRWVGIDLSPMANELVRQRLFREVGLGYEGRPHVLRRAVTHRNDIPQRTDITQPIPYQQNKHVLFGQQEGLCNGCKVMFPFVNFTVDHIVPRARGGTDHLENLQLLCGHCNSIKGDRPQEFLMARLAEFKNL